MARIEESRRTYIEELSTNPRVNLMVLSERINIAFHEDENEVSLAEKIEREGKAVILRPEYTIDSLEKDIDVLKQTYDMGYRVTKENINRIKELF